MSGDNLVFEESLNTEIDTSQFIKKSWVYVNDNNSQNYTSQVVIDTTPLSNAGGWINLQEAFIVIPLVVQLTSNNAGSLPLGTPKADWAWGFKNAGALQMINSCTVEFNNQNIVQQTSFTNVFRTFKLLTSFSEEDVINEGADIIFCPDSSNSWAYCPATNTGSGEVTGLQANGQVGATNVGIGISNNRNSPSLSTYLAVASNALNTPSFVASPVAGQPVIAGDASVSFQGVPSPNREAGAYGDHNAGFAKRQSYVNYDANVVQTASGCQNLVNPSSSCETVYRSNKNQSVAGSIVWRCYVKLRLKDLHDYFEKTPLMRGATIRMYLNTNQSIVNFTTTAGVVGGVNPTLQINSVNVVGGLTCPLMIASNMWGSGASALTPDTYNLSVSIFKNNNSVQTAIENAQTSLQSCRLYAPVYYMNALSESRYLSLAPTRQIKYRDIFQYQFSGIAGNNNSFNFLVSNGINAVKSICVIPYVSAQQPAHTVNGINIPAVTNAFNYALNPCSSSPATPDPIMLSNFNILVSGVNLFLNNSQYDFENFREQLLSSNQLNANLTTGFTSGLIGPGEFTNLYRYYYGDASRCLPQDENLSRSIQIIGTNASTLTIDLLVFVEFERTMTIDTATGARIE